MNDWGVLLLCLSSGLDATVSAFLEVVYWMPLVGSDSSLSWFQSFNLDCGGEYEPF